MSSQPATTEDDIPPPQRPPSPPPHVTAAARGIHYPTFSAFRPKDIRITSQHGMTHVAWSCDGRRLAAVGIDKITRVFQPDTSMELRQASLYSGAHKEEVDYVTWNPTHPDLFCTSSSKDRQIVFWDARTKQPTQSVTPKFSPTWIDYAPDGRSLLYISLGHKMYFMTLEKDEEGGKDQWTFNSKDALPASTAKFNHVGDGIIVSHYQESTLRRVDYPSLTLRDSPAAHVSGCKAVALDPRGGFLASGGKDSIVDIFDLSEWICARTIGICDRSINALSYSHDGEYLAIASEGLYIDICATETGEPLHRVPALAPSPTVSWHPSKYVIAYCGRTPAREGGPARSAVISLFGPGLST